ncbi:unnamed protein product [Rotaria sp. Silwood2]|nr:unnamed protein product [Rotaria sp. Silwood2]CAF3087588.1 unnamed protein product [Rotaria sp. Silwood2]CAF4182751.1 unnamed protein product [Rotaria sp. Silwood2]CAF4349767.1 unnamed protein product [Rotaria sp. Silwood2]
MFFVDTIICKCIQYRPIYNTIDNVLSINLFLCFFFSSHVLYVISLDGKITAIDVQQKGRQLWIANIGLPLVDSTINKIEISHDSKSIRLIPSLLGGLYGIHDENEHMEPLPFDAESLLNTSFHLHDEFVMIGGKDIDTIGLDLHTGKTIYSSSKDDVDQTTFDSTCSASILIIKRIKQTVRARCLRNGHEKWNFSVSNHQLMHLYIPSSSEILEKIDNYNENPVFFEYQLQTGLILAFDYNNHLIWTSSINNPIAAVWELKNGQLKEKSLLKTRLSHRLAFMGKFNSIPYVIISSRVQRQLIYHARKKNVFNPSNMKKPLLSFSYKTNKKHHLSINSKLSNNNDRFSTVDHNYPLVVRQDESLDIVGYLELIDSHEDIAEEEKYELSVDINSNSTWILWINILTISSVCFCALIIILIWYCKQKHIDIQHQKLIISKNNDITFEHQLSEPTFQSRYILEYEHVRVLGRGGFGIVFEAINKLDERRVAIKRVPLKKSLSTERALKEIRCLAILNHPNLIQYYYAWHECPPNGWQDEKDKKLILRNNELTKDSLSIYSTSAVSNDDNQSDIQSQQRKLSSTSCLSPLIDFTFERSLNLSQIHEGSNSSLCEHSYDSSNEEISNNDDKIIFNESKSSIEKTSSDCSITYFYFVMELCQTESLRNRLIKQTIKKQSEAWSIVDQIINGIEYIHSKKLIHRDLKPSNILFSMNNIVKIGDFGLVSAFGEDKIEKIDHTENNEFGGTILYMSPEQINRQSYNQKVDIYAIGIILFELLYPFSTQMERIRALENIRLQTPVFPIDFQCNQSICRLIQWLLAYSPHDRPKACEFRQDCSYQNIVKGENLVY